MAGSHVAHGTLLQADYARLPNLMPSDRVIKQIGFHGALLGVIVARLFRDEAAG
jgi:hypothetical protein